MYHLRFDPRYMLTLLLLLAGLAQARTAEDELGSWYIYNGTFRYTDQWSMFTEAQVRLYEVTSNVNDVFVRAAAHYDFTPHVMAGLGYMHAEVRPFDETSGELDLSENRIYQQFGLKHPVARAGFEHRYRLEQRWLQSERTTTYKSRFRYRLQITVPLTQSSMASGTTFVNFYDEIFLDLGDELGLDQNRLYGAVGYQFTPLSNLQLGYLYQSKPNESFRRLQFFYTHNFDFRRDQ